MDEGLERQRRLDRWAALQAVETRLEQAPLASARVHAQLLRDGLELASAYSREGQSLSVAPQVALLLRCSGSRAERLLNEAAVLVELPGGLEALEQGLLTVEQSAVVAIEIGRVPDLATRLVVWRRLVERLQADLGAAATLPVPRLRVLLRRWVLEAAPKDAEEQREQAAAGRKVEYRRRPDGLADLLLLGVSGSLAQAVLSRVRAHAEPVSPFDDRSADQRRLDAAVDLLLGRVGQPRSECSTAAGGGAGAVCGCLPGTAVPCGAELLVHVPIGAALGTTSEVAEVAGHGPVEPEVLRELLLAAPLLRAVHVDADGVPVSVSDRTWRPLRRDPVSVRAALLDLAAAPPGPPQPRHPLDHPPRPGDDPPNRPRGDQRTEAAADAPAQTDRGTETDRPTDRATDRATEPATERATDRETDRATQSALPGAHPPGTPGPYRPSRRLRRLVAARAPRCEFPGCGMLAVRCDDEHDVAWPDGPTCACQLGPCCRRHHRVKQEGWVKLRLAGSAVRWTSPTGRDWLSRPQHPTPAPPLRPPPAIRRPSEWDELDPASLEHELWLITDRPDDPAGLELRARDPETASDGAAGAGHGGHPDEEDLLGQHITAGGTRWTLDLDDPYDWTDVPPAPLESR